MEDVTSYDPGAHAVPRDGVMLVTFLLVHAGCGEHPIERRLGDGRMVCRCRWCGEAELFGGDLRPQGGPP